MMVYIVSQRYANHTCGVYGSKIKRVFSTKELATEFVEKKEAKGDYNWFVVSKDVLDHIPEPKVIKEKVVVPVDPEWMFKNENI